MLKTFDCPKCGAPVSYEKDVIGANLTARCSYCNSSLSVPDELRGRPAQIISQVHIDFKGSGTAKGSKWLLLIVLVPVIGVIIAVIAMSGALVSVLSGKKSSLVAIPAARPGLKSAGVKGENDFATQTLNFGSEGIGPGKFKDARAIAVDGSGKIYVGEYSGGRIQVFDAQGKFITQWTVDPKMPLRGMAADRNGTVYVVQSGVISRHDGASGAVLGQIPYAGGWGFDNVVVTADGGLVAAWYKNRDDIVRLSSSGQVTRTIQAAISSVTDRSELDTHVAVDGLGNIYALGTFNNAVFKFSPEGKFLTRFGDDGDQPGQFRGASAIAVDGKGRVYVSDFKGVQVFDNNGRYLTVFKPQGSASGMVFNDNDELFVAARDHVIKLTIKESL
ncbi:MAG TPA: NHL repeat-containing protein [Pyrinomonadaceae bacterium]|nr:NHL repeat-containing protein [Pyrinomonadaceae bacterium]